MRATDDPRNIGDTRDGTPPRFGSRAVLEAGETHELRKFLQDVLQIPRSARRFTVTFAVGEPLVVSVEYLPETYPVAKDAP